MEEYDTFNFKREYAVAFSSKANPGKTVIAPARDLADAQRDLAYYRDEDGYADAQIVVRTWTPLT